MRGECSTCTNASAVKVWHTHTRNSARGYRDKANIYIYAALGEMVVIVGIKGNPGLDM